MLYRATVLLALMTLSQCSPKPAENPAPASATASDFSYDLALSFTPEAAEHLKKSGEKLTISARYYGLPTPEAAHLVTPDGVIGFNTDTVIVEPLNQNVHMTGAGIQKERLVAIVGPKPLVQITAFALHDGVKDERLSCRVFQDYVATAQEKPLPFSCSLVP
ncbi:hypothetical protein [Asticcacaulis benevestitus]|uniref:Uncharacterized protein n=1 Tax=Asticcacaulis benevestitus DSM 16100 = ATCC BAA-896 TaxID=1121022 RepID=V4PU38_9CAUL|nr:hypothetical protein [Asticcacaulis benevestitus]ESQ90904.1 hypothetical protein ABENE_11585 [Asticcacaulis benevestitus DSM 16100 = ATCC BAA-896]